MKLIRSIIPFILIACLLLTFSACSGGDDGSQSSAVSEDGKQTDESPDGSGTVSDEPVSEAPYAPAARDLEGREIVFLVPGSNYTYYESFEIYAEEKNDEAINDAVFERNQIVQERLNCVISAEKTANVAQDMLKYINSGVYYDVYMPMINDVAQIVGDGLMYDLNEFEDLKLDQPWWDQHANEGLSIFNKLYFSTGDISILDNDCTMVVFFNKKLTSQYDVDPYAMVDDRSWTIDKIYEIGRDFTENLEDAAWNDKDHYGLHVAFNAPHSFFFGCGGTITETDNDGKIRINMNSESNINIINKVFEIAYKPDVVTNKTPNCTTFEDICRMFLNDQIMFTTFALTDLKNFRSVYGFEYGILPYPLLNSEQEDYHCLISTVLVPVVTIPVDCPDPEDVALVLENMAFYSRDTVTRAYYDITLKGRDLGDEESEKMLDLIFSSRVYDLGYIYNFGGLGLLIQNMNDVNDSNFVSRFAQLEPKAQSQLEEVLYGFED